MTNNVTPIKRQRVKIDTCSNDSRFYFANFNGGECDDLRLIDSLGYALRQVAGLLDVIAGATEEESQRYAIRSAEFECRDASAILDAWWKAHSKRPKKASGGAS